MVSKLPGPLPDDFVGREPQLEQLRHALATAREVAVIGPFGSGKTTLVQAFLAKAETAHAFPGGVFIVQPSRYERPDQLIARIPDAHNPALVVLDDAPLLGHENLREFRLALSARPELKWLLVSPDPLAIEGITIELPPLTVPEAKILIEERLGLIATAFGSDLLDSVYTSAGGYPRALLGIGDLFASGAISSSADLAQYLKAFHTPGMLRHGTNDSAAKERKVIVDTSFVNAEIFGLLTREPKLLRELPPRKFEEIVAELLERQGYTVELTPASKDGGFDMYAAKKEGLGQFLYLVECKRYVPPNKVGVGIIRSLYGVVQAMRATAGVVVTTSFFTAGAEKYSSDLKHQLSLKDYVALQKWLEEQH